jgi:NAD(P)-dependent dehydrogenase (short-subunit alcohol dehydrogenase family)
MEGESGAGPLLLLGGRSEIGLALAARLVAEQPRPVVLAARRAAELDEPERLLRSAGASEVHRLEFDADDVAGHPGLLDRAAEAAGEPELVVLAFGVLGDQARAETDTAHALAVIHTDYTAQVSLLTEAARRMRARARGRLVVFSSVAGVRVRRANYVYGSAKAGLDGFASGLADALAGTGVSLLLVRPGFVIGRMTSGMSPAPFSSTPEQVAEVTARALAAGRGEVWVPRVLQPLFGLLRFAPRAVWRRLPR